jgi:hypothetical protein
MALFLDDLIEQLQAYREQVGHGTNEILAWDEFQQDYTPIKEIWIEAIEGKKRRVCLEVIAE